MTPLGLPVLGINSKVHTWGSKGLSHPALPLEKLFGNKTPPAPGRKVSVAELCGWLGWEGVNPWGRFLNPLRTQGRGCWVYIYWSYTRGELDSQLQHMTVTQELRGHSLHHDLGEETSALPVTSQSKPRRSQSFPSPNLHIPSHFPVQTLAFPATSQPHWYNHGSGSSWTPAQSLNLLEGMWQKKQNTSEQHGFFWGHRQPLAVPQQPQRAFFCVATDQCGAAGE